MMHFKFVIAIFARYIHFTQRNIQYTAKLLAEIRNMYPLDTQFTTRFEDVEHSHRGNRWLITSYPILSLTS